MFRLKNVTKIFTTKNSEKIALNDITINLGDTGLNFIVGKSGSGKSTFLNVVSGLDSLTKGEITYNDLNYKDLKDKEFDALHYKTFGFVFQDYCLLENLTVADNIALGALKNARRLKKQIKEILEQVDLKGYSKKLCKELSGGEKQRVALARALIKKPQVIFCDEPTGNLDKNSTEKVLKILKQMSKKRLVLIVSHNEENAYQYADRIIRLNNGKVIEDKSLDRSNKPKGYYLVSSSIYTDQNEINKVNTLLKDDKIKGLCSNYINFIDTDNSNIRPESVERNLKSRCHCHKTIAKLFNRNQTKNIVFSFITSIVLALYSICISLSSFSVDPYISENYSADKKIQVLQKSVIDDEGALSFYFYNKIMDEDFSKLENVYKGSYYKKYKYYFPCVSYSYDSNSLSNVAYDSINFNKFYPKSANNLVVTNKEYLLSLLETNSSTLNIIENPKGKRSDDKSIYVTDFIADSYLYNEKLLGKVTNYNRFFTNFNSKYHGYVNGIIQTNYRQECEPLMNELLNNKNKKISVNSNNIKILDRMLNVYAPTYAFDEGFVENYKVDVDTYYIKIGYNISFSSSKSNFDLSCKSISFDESIKDDEVVVADSIGNYFSSSYIDSNDLQNQINKEGSFNLEIKNSIQGDIACNANFSLSKEINKVTLSSIYKKTNTINSKKSTAIIYLSKNNFDALRNNDFFPTTIYIEDVSQINNVKTILEDCSFTFASFLYRPIINVTKGVARFSTIFAIFKYVSLITVCSILIYYLFDLVNSEKYNIGIIKSLGVRNRDICYELTIKIILFSISTSILYAFTYYALAKASTKAILSSYGKLSPFNYDAILHNIVKFTPSIYVFIATSLLVFSLITSLITLIKLMKIKPTTIIKNKD